MALPVACNINYKEQLEQLVAAARAKWGRIDVLVCNAAINPYFGPQLEMPDEAFDKLLVATVCALVCATAAAQQWPAKPLRLITVGGADALPRILAQKISEPLGQQVVVEERAATAGSEGGLPERGNSGMSPQPLAQMCLAMP